MPIFSQRWTRTGATEVDKNRCHRGGQEPVPQSWTRTGATEVDKNRCHIIYTYNIMPIFPQRWTRTGATTYTYIISCQSSHRGGQEPVPQNIYTYNIMPIFPQRWTRTGATEYIHIISCQSSHRADAFNHHLNTRLEQYSLK
jgi:hypothetical protein